MNYKQFTDVELLREVLLERKDTYVAEALLNEYGSLPDAILNCSNNEIKYLEVNGLGIRKKAQIMAIQELVNRLMTIDYGRGNYKITSPSDAAKLMMNELKFKNHEEAWIVCVNQSNVVMDCFRLSIGGVASAIIDPRCVFERPIRLKSCGGIFLIHNHPSHFAGNATVKPSVSNEDVEVSRRLREVGKLLNIPLIDSLIIGMNRYTSLKEEGYLA